MKTENILLGIWICVMCASVFYFAPVAQYTTGHSSCQSNQKQVASPAASPASVSPVLASLGSKTIPSPKPQAPVEKAPVEKAPRVKVNRPWFPTNRVVQQKEILDALPSFDPESLRHISCRDEPHRCVWTTLTTTNNDAWRPALALIQSIRESGSKYGFMLMLLGDLPPELEKKFLAWNVTLVKIDEIPSINPAHHHRAALHLSWHKLRLWQFIQYYRVVFLDNDIMFVKNADELFDLPGTSSAPGQCAACETSYGLNGGMVVITPEPSIYDKMVQVYPNMPPTSDQHFIDIFFDGVRAPVVHWLAPLYNIAAGSCTCMNGDAWKTMKLIHFLCTTKPYFYYDQKHMDWSSLKDLPPPCLKSLIDQWAGFMKRALQGFGAK